MIPRDRTGIARIARAVVPLAVITFAAAVLVFFPPAQNSFYPQCPIQEYLHLQCPGCGATRALAALLHGHLAEAFRFNALVTALLPFATAYGLYSYQRFLQREPVRWPQPPPAATYAAFAVTIVFTVTRNLPLHSF
jgi:Protein of unknown function (DUF2752)